jgi:hypothetical protein
MLENISDHLYLHSQAYNPKPNLFWAGYLSFTMSVVELPPTIAVLLSACWLGPSFAVIEHRATAQLEQRAGVQQSTIGLTIAELICSKCAFLDNVIAGSVSNNRRAAACLDFTRDWGVYAPPVALSLVYVVVCLVSSTFSQLVWNSELILAPHNPIGSSVGSSHQRGSVRLPSQFRGAWPHKSFPMVNCTALMFWSVIDSLYSACTHLVDKLRTWANTSATAHWLFRPLDLGSTVRTAEAAVAFRLLRLRGLSHMVPVACVPVLVYNLHTCVACECH